MNPSTSSSTSSVLQNVSIFQDIKHLPEALLSLEKIMKPRKYSKGHVLITQGESGQEFFVLLNGQVSIEKDTPEGDRYKVAVLKGDQHSAFGEGGLIEGEARSATVTCDTDVECLVLSCQEFAQFSLAQPQYALPVLKRIALILMSRLNQTSNDLMLLHKALMSEIRSS
ncbi:MAG: cyclic nucleotide-binding domain-containing protein [Pseudobdellovibrionaceae bacterium]